MTEDHRFWSVTDDAWVELQDLDTSDVLLTPDGATVTVDFLDWDAGVTTDSYDLTVDRQNATSTLRSTCTDQPSRWVLDVGTDRSTGVFGKGQRRMNPEFVQRLDTLCGGTKTGFVWNPDAQIDRLPEDCLLYTSPSPRD